ncbi:TIGR00730 family Rossman fold protein [Parasphaerochaeta coccoides]|uniref:Cytokinin riboside 5'-monophosphate phosphoribohydrolase n=1 Tax=Parasphaerochaeta coccoides (strain ATCC BAA-1237 / DSM 17374 / SPN1) TaxID=760011 RepID=F4GM03_PARC1|nr:TIGR00730 family Rossman fold protein [Parasphaerochaeta coccoides]AEC02478.1 Conserved hypothetical protein CHP00730 [Parasphaerochaeta coccoides DSM 17374]
MAHLHSIAVFCGSSHGSDPAFTTAAKNLGVAFCERGIALVYGGGNRGIMGTLATTVHEKGGKVTGVLPRFFDVPAVRTGEKNTSVEIVSGMHERKARMADLADGFIVLPGGIGTCDEFFETYTWKQIGLHDKPIALLNTKGFYNGLLSFLNSASSEGFISREALHALIIEENPARLLDRMEEHQAVLPEKLG